MENKLPTDARFLEAANASDDLHVVIRGHQLVEQGLNAAIAEALREPHALEVGRLTVGLKIDLGVALGAVRLESRPSFVGLNRLRNRFAHQSDAALSTQDAQDLLGTLSPDQRHTLDRLERDVSKGSPREIVSDVLSVLFVEVTAAVGRQALWP